jgi:hypothetical protein
MKLMKKIDMFLVKNIVKPLVQMTERFTGTIPATLTYLIAITGVFTTLRIGTFFLIAEIQQTSPVTSAQMCIYVTLVVLTLFYIFNLVYLHKKAVTRWSLYFKGALRTIPGTGVIYDTARWKWLVAHVCISGFLFAKLNHGSLPLYAVPLFPALFIWPALAICGVQPYYKTSRREQGKRVMRSFVTFIVCALLLIRHIYLDISQM